MKAIMDYKDIFYIAQNRLQNEDSLFKTLNFKPLNHDVIICYIPLDSGSNTFFRFVEAAHYTVGSNHYTERENRNDYQLILTISGKGHVLYEEKEYVLSPNTAMLIDCRKPHKYFVTQGNQWEYKHLHFKTDFPNYLLHLIPVFQNNCFDAISKFDKIIKFSSSPDSKVANFHYIYSSLIDTLLTSLLLQHQRNLIASSQNDNSFHDVIQYIEEHYTEPIKITDLAEKFNYSREYLIRRFKTIYGSTPHQYLIQYRINMVFERVAKGESISSAVLNCGFNSTSSFYYTLKSQKDSSEKSSKRFS